MCLLAFTQAQKETRPDESAEAMAMQYKQQYVARAAATAAAESTGLKERRSASALDRRDDARALLRDDTPRPNLPGSQAASRSASSGALRSLLLRPTSSSGGGGGSASNEPGTARRRLGANNNSRSSTKGGSTPPPAEEVELMFGPPPTELHSLPRASYRSSGHMCTASRIELVSLAVPAAGPGYAERCV